MALMNSVFLNLLLKKNNVKDITIIARRGGGGEAALLSFITGVSDEGQSLIPSLDRRWRHQGEV